jgi:hypothetical protein
MMYTGSERQPDTIRLVTAGETRYTMPILVRST